MKSEVMRDVAAKRSLVRYCVLGLTLAIMTLQGCGPDDPPVVCDCSANGSSQFSVESAVVINTKNGYRILSPTVGYRITCDSLGSVHKLDGLMISISGITKAVCEKPDDIYHNQLENYSEITSVTQSTDSTFQTDDFEIHIIKSESYGYGHGFGYRITHSRGINILQPTIPAIGGNKPFQSASDAFKTAVLVTYLINLDIGLPSVTVDDLEFLKVI